MLICKLSDQLGNQMFAYASIKSIAKDRGLDFKVLNEYDNQFLKNDTDKRYGCNLTTIFKNIKQEIITEIPPGFNEYQEVRKSESSFQNEVINVKDNTIMKGHYISPLYFMHRLKEVQEWFKLPLPIDIHTTNILNTIRSKYSTKTRFCSVHFRNALDYKIKGFMLSKHYWEKAAKQLLQNTDEDIIFILFYDKKSSLISRFKTKFPSIIIHGSLLEDFSLISKCDYHIVCNSSFSIMSALMDTKSIHTTYCPSIWPIPRGYYPKDTYPKQWIRVNTTRNFLSHVMGYIDPLLTPIKVITKNIISNKVLDH